MDSRQQEELIDAELVAQKLFVFSITELTMSIWLTKLASYLGKVSSLMMCHNIRFKCIRGLAVTHSSPVTSYTVDLIGYGTAW